MPQRDWNRSYDYADDWYETPPPTRPAPGKVPATARIPAPPTTNIVFRVADPATATALGTAMAPRDANAVAADASDHVARASESSGHALPDGVRTRFESSLDADLGAVRIHTGAASATAAEALGARAYTVGQDVHFATGEYKPIDPFGLHLLAHEVAHTVQQGPRAHTCQPKLAVSTPGDAAEVEADRAADAMVGGAPASVSGAGPEIQLRPKAPAVPSAAEADAQNRIHSSKLAAPRNAVGKAIASIDWSAYQQFLTTAKQASDQYDANSSQVDVAHDAIVERQTDLNAGLQLRYDEESSKIAALLNDPESDSVRAPMKAIKSKSDQIVEALAKRTGELTTAEGALDTIAGLSDEKEAKAKEGDEKKLQNRKAAFEAAKAAALADVAANAAFLSGALDFAESAATEGPVGAAKSLAKGAGKGAVKDAIVGAYSKFATGKVNAQYNGSIRSISSKIAGVQAKIKSLKSSALTSQLSGASKQFKGAMQKVEAHNKTIARLKTEIDGHRSEVARQIEAKHKDLALFKEIRAATATMAPLVEGYRAHLAAAKAHVDAITGHEMWLSRMNSVKGAVSGTDRVIGGDTDAMATGEVDMDDLISHNRQDKNSRARKDREKRARSHVAEYQSAVGPHIAWLTSFGTWLQSEKTFLDAELQKCLGGDFIAFIQKVEAKLHGLINANFL